MMKISTLTDKTVAELRILLKETAMINLKHRLQVAGKHSTQHHQVRVSRRDMARIQTVITRKLANQLGSAS